MSFILERTFLFYHKRKDCVMRLPNGFGSVYKLSGNRRKPWAARKTVGWTFDEENQKAYPKYEFIGYYKSKKEALTALTDYNKDPYELNDITFAELYERWSVVHFEKVSKSNINGVKAAYKLCDSIKDMRVVDIKLGHLQAVVDHSGKNKPTLRKLKVMLGLMYDYAVMHEIVETGKREMVRYVDISLAGNPNGYDRKPFTKSEIKKLWEMKDANVYFSVILILIYTGLRISELLNLEKKDVHLDERYLYIEQSKTASGIREVPIAEKIVPLMQYWMERDCDHLICTPSDNPFLYRNYTDTCFKPLAPGHKPHDTRHTCISLLAEAGVDERIIKKIVGHKGQGVTESVYTHIELPIKLEAINKI